MNAARFMAHVAFKQQATDYTLLKAATGKLFDTVYDTARPYVKEEVEKCEAAEADLVVRHDALLLMQQAAIHRLGLSVPGVRR